VCDTVIQPCSTPEKKLEAKTKILKSESVGQTYDNAVGHGNNKHKLLLKYFIYRILINILNNIKFSRITAK